MSMDDDLVLQRLEDENHRLKCTLILIATGPRPDGTYNRDRFACQLLAKQTLDSLLSEIGGDE